MEKNIRILRFRGEIMASSHFHEILQRGTSDFPISYYFVNENSPRYHMQTHWHKDIEVIRVLSGRLNVHAEDNADEILEILKPYII